MKWVFADATELHLGGEVVGDTRFANAVRESLRLGTSVCVLPPPGGFVDLDTSVPCHVDAFARDEARLRRNPLVSTPEGVEYPTRGDEEEYVEGRVY